MRRLFIIALLLVMVVLGACHDVAGPGRGGSLDGQWSGQIDGERIWISLRDDRGVVRGSGDWGYDDIDVWGERLSSSEIYLRFDFRRYNPIELEGRIRGSEIEGRLYGSGYQGDRIRLRRGSRW